MTKTRDDLLVFGLILAVIWAALPFGTFSPNSAVTPTAEASARTKTIVFFVGSNVSTTAAASAATTTFNFTITLPDLFPMGTPIRSAYIMYNTHWNNVAGLTASSFTLNKQGGSAQALATPTALNTSSENLQLAFRIDATAAMQTLIGNASGTYAMTFTANMTGPTRMAESAELFVTYDFDPFATTQVNTAYKFVYATTSQLGTAVVTSANFNFALPEAGATSTFAVGGSSTNHFWMQYRGRVSGASITAHIGWDAETTSSATFAQAGNSFNFLLLMVPKTANASSSANHTFKMQASAATAISGLNAVAATTYTFNFTNSTTLRRTLPILLVQSSAAASAANIDTETPISITEGSASTTDAFLWGRTVFTTAANPGMNANITTSTCSFPATSAITMSAASTDTTGYPTVVWDVSGNVRFSTSGSYTICSRFSSAANANIRGMMLFLSYNYAKSVAAGARWNSVIRMLGPQNETAGTNFATTSIDTRTANASASIVYSWLNADYNDNGTGNAVAAQTLTLELGGASTSYAFLNTGENTHGEVFSGTSTVGFTQTTVMQVDCAVSCINDATFNMWYQAQFVSSSIRQAHFHWRNDDGGETTSTARAAEDAASTSTIGSRYRLRFGIVNDGDTTSTIGMRLEYQKATTSGSWVQVATTTVGSADWQMATSSLVAHNTPTTNISTSTGGITDENGYFLASAVIATSSTNQAGNITISGVQFSEVEYTIQPTSNALNDTYYFRVTNAGAVLDVYDLYASTVFSLPNQLPVVSAVTLNGGSPIVLTPNATTSIYVNFTVTDNNGCADVFTNGNVTTTLYRSGVGTSCTKNNLSCYIVTSVTHDCTSGTSANATATVDIWYFAQATDASSSFPSENWNAFVQVMDAAAATSTSSSTQELGTLLAIDVVSSTLNYGSLAPGSDTGSTTQESVVVNVGNTSSSLQISGTALTSGSNVIATSSQHYGTSTFTFGGSEQVLTSGATTVSGITLIGATLGTWSETTALPNVNTTNGVAPLVANQGYMYYIGGNTTTVFVSQVSATSGLGAWSTTTPISAPLEFGRSESYNRYIYHLGGELNASVGTTTVEFATTTATGGIAAWTDTSALPSPRTRGGSALHNGYLYYVGGSNTGAGPGSTSTVYFAQINTSTGALAAWSSTTPIPGTGYANFSAVAYNGYLYSVGGYNVTNNAGSSSVWFAPINSTGSIGSWSSTTPLNFGAGVQHPSVIVSNGIMYVIGGALSGGLGNTSTALFAPILSNGHLASWTQTTAFADDVFAAGTRALGDAVYLAGGNQSGNETTTVRLARLRNDSVYWGAQVPTGTPAGTYSGTVTYTAVFTP